jgi:hypothetical protein
VALFGAPNGRWERVLIGAAFSLGLTLLALGNARSELACTRSAALPPSCEMIHDSLVLGQSRVSLPPIAEVREEHRVAAPKQRESWNVVLLDRRGVRPCDVDPSAQGRGANRSAQTAPCSTLAVCTASYVGGRRSDRKIVGAPADRGRPVSCAYETREKSEGKFVARAIRFRRGAVARM